MTKLNTKYAIGTILVFSLVLAGSLDSIPKVNALQTNDHAIKILTLNTPLNTVNVGHSNQTYSSYTFTKDVRIIGAQIFQGEGAFTEGEGSGIIYNFQNNDQIFFKSMHKENISTYDAYTTYMFPSGTSYQINATQKIGVWNFWSCYGSYSCNSGVIATIYYYEN